MSNIDKSALREAAEKATPGPWYVHDKPCEDGNYGIDTSDKEFLAEAVVWWGFARQSIWREEDAKHIAAANPATVLALLDELEAAEKRIAEMQALARGVKQFSEFQICHYGATEDYAKGYIDCQNNYNKVLFAAAGKGE
ncbi:ead/Ea22-like family protein [Enterobacter hormaechei]|uniref:ead/Ea22-like family protein n=1 Tax=Enterobacter hormaechei TaxID=158836 RepID=UPI00294A00CB|nr:ead/Ea22-like family protein [Enterobacter hormaechei]MDV5526812.1 ead/Ea22-like family protein [Enterobacter hormaechei]HBL9065104.1 ead/Ea22-like family protein [Enterobacter hormaechei]